MTKTILFTTLIAITAMAFKWNTPNPSDEIVMPENVKSIVDAKCYGCHSPEGKSDKAKDKLLWDELSNLSKIKQISKLDNISEVVEKGDMPPEKFLESHPDKKLTDEEAKILKDWAISTAQKILD